jgi:membrane protein
MRSESNSSWKRISPILRETYDQWDKDNASSLAAALAYYAAFATAPLLVLLVAVLGAVLGRGAVRAEVLQQAHLAIGREGEAIVTLLLDNATLARSSMIAVVLGVATLLVTISGLFSELSNSLEIVWKVPPEQLSVIGFVKRRALGFVMVPAGGGFLLLSMISSAVLDIVSAWLALLGPVLHTLIQLGNFLVSLVGVTGLFAIAFKVLSRTTAPWRDVWKGALVTAVFFSIGKWLMALYFSQMAVASSFGAAGSLAVFLAWVYYTAYIFFLGAELTHVCSKHRADSSVPGD